MEINFTPYTQHAEKLLSPPTPAKNSIPEWYKKTNLYLEEGDKYPGLAKEQVQATNTTIKACTPFLDALTAGYMWHLPVDLEVRKYNSEYSFRWRPEGDYITTHSPNQHPLLPTAFNGESFVLKWHFEFIIQTPPGYSTLFMHPANRNDLPFRTFTGIVDTDKYNVPVQFPFQIFEQKEDLVIWEKGMPVCQIIPFKRENWNSKMNEYNEEFSRKSLFSFKSKIIRSYKNNFWTKKTFN